MSASVWTYHVRDMDDRFTLIQDTLEIDQIIRDHAPDQIDADGRHEYASLFVRTADADIVEIYGTTKIAPDLDDHVWTILGRPVCLSCRSWAHRERTGSWPDYDPRGNRAMMWGCTCDPVDAEAASDYMEMITR